MSTLGEQFAKALAAKDFVGNERFEDAAQTLDALSRSLTTEAD